MQHRALPRLRDGKERREEKTRTVFVFGPHLFSDTREDLALTGWIVDGRTALALRGRDLTHDLQTLQEQVDQLMINLVNLSTDVLDVDHNALLTFLIRSIVFANISGVWD